MARGKRAGGKKGWGRLPNRDPDDHVAGPSGGFDRSEGSDVSLSSFEESSVSGTRADVRVDLPTLDSDDPAYQIAFGGRRRAAEALHTIDQADLPDGVTAEDVISSAPRSRTKTILVWLAVIALLVLLIVVVTRGKGDNVVAQTSGKPKVPTPAPELPGYGGDSSSSSSSSGSGDSSPLPSSPSPSPGDHGDTPEARHESAVRRSVSVDAGGIREPVAVTVKWIWGDRRFAPFEEKGDAASSSSSASIFSVLRAKTGSGDAFVRVVFPAALAYGSIGFSLVTGADAEVLSPVSPGDIACTRGLDCIVAVPQSMAAVATGLVAHGRTVGFRKWTGEGTAILYADESMLPTVCEPHAQVSTLFTGDSTPRPSSSSSSSSSSSLVPCEPVVVVGAPVGSGSLTVDAGTGVDRSTLTAASVDGGRVFVSLFPRGSLVNLLPPASSARLFVPQVFTSSERGGGPGLPASQVPVVAAGIVMALEEAMKYAPGTAESTDGQQRKPRETGVGGTPANLQLPRTIAWLPRMGPLRVTNALFNGTSSVLIVVEGGLGSLWSPVSTQGRLNPPAWLSSDPSGAGAGGTHNQYAAGDPGRFCHTFPAISAVRMAESMCEAVMTGLVSIPSQSQSQSRALFFDTASIGAAASFLAPDCATVVLTRLLPLTTATPGSHGDGGVAEAYAGACPMSVRWAHWRSHWMSVWGSPDAVASRAAFSAPGRPVHVFALAMGIDAAKGFSSVGGAVQTCARRVLDTTVEGTEDSYQRFNLRVGPGARLSAMMGSDLARGMRFVNTVVDTRGAEDGSGMQLAPRGERERAFAELLTSRVAEVRASDAVIDSGPPVVAMGFSGHDYGHWAVTQTTARDMVATATSTTDTTTTTTRGSTKVTRSGAPASVRSRHRFTVRHDHPDLTPCDDEYVIQTPTVPLVVEIGLIPRMWTRVAFNTSCVRNATIADSSDAAITFAGQGHIASMGEMLVNFVTQNPPRSCDVATYDNPPFPGARPRDFSDLVFSSAWTVTRLAGEIGRVFSSAGAASMGESSLAPLKSAVTRLTSVLSAVSQCASVEGVGASLPIVLRVACASMAPASVFPMTVATVIGSLAGVVERSVGAPDVGNNNHVSDAALSAAMQTSVPVFEPLWPRRRVMVPLGVVALSLGTWGNHSSPAVVNALASRGGECPNVLSMELCAEAVLMAIDAQALETLMSSVGAAVESAPARYDGNTPASEPGSCGPFCDDHDLAGVYVTTLVTAATRFTIGGAAVAWRHLSQPRNWQRFESAVRDGKDRAFVLGEIAARLPGGDPQVTGGGQGDNYATEMASFVTEGVYKDSFGGEEERAQLVEIIERCRIASLAIRNSTQPNTQ